MLSFGASEALLFGVIAAILLGGRLPAAIRALKIAAQGFAEGLRDQCNSELRTPRNTTIELVTQQREPTMTERFKKFLWSPAFWALLGIFGCVSGAYFQRVAANGCGLWCLGLMFLGAAYLEHND
jgi:hypothetical protein